MPGSATRVDGDDFILRPWRRADCFATHKTRCFAIREEGSDWQLRPWRSADLR